MTIKYMIPDRILYWSGITGNIGIRPKGDKIIVSMLNLLNLITIS